MIALRCVLCVVRCVLFVVCCLLCGVCCSCLFGFVACCVSCVLFAVLCELRVVFCCCMLHVAYCVLVDVWCSLRGLLFALLWCSLCKGCCLLSAGEYVYCIVVGACC